MHFLLKAEIYFELSVLSHAFNDYSETSWEKREVIKQHCHNCLEVLQDRLDEDKACELAVRASNLLTYYYEMDNEFKNEYEEAKKWSLHTQMLCETKWGSESKEFAWSLGATAMLYMNRKDFAEARKLMLKMLELQKKIPGFENPQIRFLRKASDLCEKNEQISDATYYQMQALELQRKIVESKDDLIWILTKLAGLYEKNEQVSEAISHLLEALELQKEVGDSKREQSHILFDLERLYEKSHQLPEAQKCRNEASTMLDEILREAGVLSRVPNEDPGSRVTMTAAELFTTRKRPNITETD